MATDSSIAGYLAPTSSASYDNALDDILHDLIMHITGLPGALVRPRWQPEPPQQPDFATDWCAFGILRAEVDTFPHERRAIPDAEETYIERDEKLFYLHSFYGPNAHGYVERFRDGLMIGQNRAALAALNVAVVEVMDATILPALLKEKWVKRVDITTVYRRRTSRTFAVRTVQSAQSVLDNEHYVTPINVTNP